jgi:hypothetical protein
MVAGVASCVLSAGCTAPVLSGALQLAQYGTSTFNSGALETYYPNSVDECITAVRKTVSDLGLRPVTDVPKPDEGFLYLKVKDEAGEEILIRVRRRAENLTMVRIRVGTLGDEPYSNALMKHVTELLDPMAQRVNARDPQTSPDPKPLKAPAGAPAAGPLAPAPARR